MYSITIYYKYFFYQGIHEDQNHNQNLNKNHPDTLQAAFVAVRFWCLLAVITS